MKSVEIKYGTQIKYNGSLICAAGRISEIEIATTEKGSKYIQGKVNGKRFEIFGGVEFGGAKNQWSIETLGSTYPATSAVDAIKQVANNF